MNVTQASLSGIAIVILIITIAISLPQGTQVGGKHRIIYDKKIMSVFQNISDIVPKQEPIVTLRNIPIVEYFTERQIFFPETVRSYDSLLKLMKARNYNYLLVFENQSEIEEMLQYFRKENLHKLSKDFYEIQKFRTDFYRIHLYKRLT